MSLLTICQDVHRALKCGPGEPGTGFTAVAGVTGNNADILAWVQMAYRQIQEAQRNWRWMIDEATGEETIAAGATSVTLVGDNTDYDELRPYLYGGRPYIFIYATSIGVTDAQMLWIIPWQEFSGRFDNPRHQAQTGRPQYAAINPDGTLRLEYTTDVGYKLKYQYRKTIQALTADADIPLMPTKFHDLIMYLAMSLYGGGNESNRVREDVGTTLEASRGNTRIGALYRRLCIEQLPPVQIGGDY